MKSLGEFEKKVNPADGDITESPVHSEGRQRENDKIEMHSMNLSVVQEELHQKANFTFAATDPSLLAPDSPGVVNTKRRLKPLILFE